MINPHMLYPNSEQVPDHHLNLRQAQFMHHVHVRRPALQRVGEPIEVLESLRLESCATIMAAISLCPTLDHSSSNTADREP